MLCYTGDWGYQPTVTVTFHSRTWVGNHLNRLKELFYQCKSDHIQCKMNNTRIFWWISSMWILDPNNLSNKKTLWWSGVDPLTLQITACIRWWFYSWVVQKDLPSFGQSLVVVLTALLSIDEMVKPSPFLGIFFIFQLSMMGFVVEIFCLFTETTVDGRNPAPPGMYKTLCIMIGIFTISTG